MAHREQARPVERARPVRAARERRMLAACITLESGQ
jgi:hypothetical protein